VATIYRSLGIDPNLTLTLADGNPGPGHRRHDADRRSVRVIVSRTKTIGNQTHIRR